MIRRGLALLLGASLAACGSDGTAPAGGIEDPSGALEVGNIAELPGTDYLVADLIEDAGDGGGISKSYTSNSVRNLLLIERDGGMAHPLLPDNKRVVERSYFIAAKPAVLLTPFDDYTQDSGSGRLPPAPAYFLIEEHPTAGQEATALRVGAMADLTSAVALDGLDKVLGRWMIDDHRLAVIAVQKAKTRYYEIDMKARTLIGSHDIPLGE